MKQITNVEPFITKVSAIEAFNTSAPDIKVAGFTKRFDLTPTSNPDYIADQANLNKILIWLTMPAISSLFLVGETGTGKTEMVYYLADKLNWPVATLQVTGATRVDDLEGYTELTVKDGSSCTRFVESNIAQIYREGGIILLDEVDKSNSDLVAVLLAIMDYKPWTLSNGTVVTPHKRTRVIGTTNTIGDGMSSRYNATKQLDSAMKGRAAWLTMGYPQSSIEIEILTNKYGKFIQPHIIEKMVTTGNLLRDLLLGVNRDGESGEDIGEPFSTRTLIAWASYMVGFGGDMTPKDSFDFVYGNGLNQSDRTVVIGAIQHLWDIDFDTPLRTLQEN